MQGSKAEKLLGLNKGINAESSVLVQIQDVLLLRESGIGGSLKKRLCVVQGGFFIYYKQTTLDEDIRRLPLEKRPLGIVPLNGAFIRINDTIRPRTQIELSHSDIVKCNYIIHCENEAQAVDWANNLKLAKRSTWENAELGAAMLEQMKAEGTKLEEEKQRAVLELQKKAEQLNKANEQKMKVLVKEREQAELFEKQISDKQRDLAAKESEKESLEKMLNEEELRLLKIKQKREELENRLAMANLALRRLETEFRGYFGGSHEDWSIEVSNDSATGAVKGKTFRENAAGAYQKALVTSSPKPVLPANKGKGASKSSTAKAKLLNNMKPNRNSTKRGGDPNGSFSELQLPTLPPLPSEVYSPEKLKESMKALRTFLSGVAEHKESIIKRDTDEISELLSEHSEQ